MAEMSNPSLNIATMILHYAEAEFREAAKENVHPEYKAGCLSEAELFREVGSSTIPSFLRIKDRALRENIEKAIVVAFTVGMRAKGDISPPAKIIMSELARLAGKASGKKRLARAAETWEPVALKLARQSRHENKGWSQDNVAHYVLEHWDKEKDRPGHRSLKKRISDWIKTGKLPEKVRQ